MVIEKTAFAEKKKSTTTTIISVYNDTTTGPKGKRNRRDKSDLGPDFVAPDGGWGWVVCLAAGFSNFSIFIAWQQYGLIYRQRMADLGLDAKQTTTIVNIVMAISSLTGIVNGAMFRRFTFRQVAITGALLVFVGVSLTAFCTSFLHYVICYSCIYGIGLGLNMAATSLAVNTYFKKSRRRATGFSWTITALGPIIFPHVSTYLLTGYGVQGTILIFAAISLNAVLCGIALQPVLWHVKKEPSPSLAKAIDITSSANGLVAGLTIAANHDLEYECKYCQLEQRMKRGIGIFASEYLFNSDDPDMPGYEITEPATPMLASANDGWYSSKWSLNSDKRTDKVKDKDKTPCPSRGDLKAMADIDANILKMNYFNRERQSAERYTSKSSVYSRPGSDLYRCTCTEERALMHKITEDEQRSELEEADVAGGERRAGVGELTLNKSLTLQQKIAKFLDLDLLRDFTFVNLALGMTIMMFCEVNFSVLTPFILHGYGYNNGQISLAMSLLGSMDISVRFLAPFALEKVQLGNQMLFAFGIISIMIGRFMVTLSDSFHVVLALFVLIGFGKGFRTIFSPLILPSYVPLNRLPAATGLQLICNSIFSIACGPILGLITDATSYTVTIHMLNTLTCCALLMWLTESMVRRMLRATTTTTTAAATTAAATTPPVDR